jgi:hypothetical protein
MQQTAQTTSPIEPALLLEMEERSAMTLLRLIAAVGIAVTVLGLALRLAGSAA